MESGKCCSTAPASHQDTQLDYETEARIFSICARAGVSVLGIQSGFGVGPDLVLFQPIGTTLALALSEFSNPERAIGLIKEKLAGQVQR